MNDSVFRLAFGMALAAFAVAETGCQKKVQVTGRVTYNGSPLQISGGEIVFVGANNSQVVASIGPDGTYRAVGVPGGLNRVAVYYVNARLHESKGLGKKRLPHMPSAGVAAPAPQPAVSPFLTPSKYAAVESSELSVEVKKGTTFDVALQGPAIP